MRNLEDRLADHHHENRWHICPDGYKWKVEPIILGLCQCRGYLLGPGGGQLAYIEELNRVRCEDRILRILSQHRNTRGEQ